MNIIEYNKKHYKQFKVDLKIDEMENLEMMLKEDKVSKASFLREAIIKYKSERMFRDFNRNRKVREKKYD